jgi:hypothetical protein
MIEGCHRPVISIAIHNNWIFSELPQKIISEEAGMHVLESANCPVTQAKNG